MRLARVDMLARLHEPVADQIGFRGHAALVGREDPCNVVFPQLADQELPAEERRVADHDIDLGPVGLVPVRREDRVAALDVVERLQDGVARLGESVAPHPLDFADPDRHAGELGRVGVDLDSPDVSRANRREATFKPKRLGLNLYPMLDVLECVQGDKKEVAGAAGRVEHSEVLQALEEVVQ